MGYCLAMGNNSGYNPTTKNNFEYNPATSNNNGIRPTTCNFVLHYEIGKCSCLHISICPLLGELLITQLLSLQSDAFGISTKD